MVTRGDSHPATYFVFQSKKTEKRYAPSIDVDSHGRTRGKTDNADICQLTSEWSSKVKVDVIPNRCHAWRRHSSDCQTPMLP